MVIKDSKGFAVRPLELRKKTILIPAIVAMQIMGAQASAEEVTLRSADGRVQINGEIAAFDDETIIVNSDLGPLRIVRSQVTCTGEGCKVLEGDDDDDNDEIAADIDFTFEMIASAGIADQLLPVIAQGLADRFEATVTTTDAFGQPLPDDIGRPLPGGPEDDDDDDDDARSDDDDDDDDEIEDLIDIRLRTADGEDVRRYGVVIEEEEEAIEELSEGDVEIIFLDEPAEEDDIAEVAEGGGGIITDAGQERVLAVEGLVVAVSTENPIPQINVDDISRIFAGEINNWAEIGGPNADINVYSFDEANAAIHYVDELVLEPADKELGDNINVIQTMSEMTSKIAADPFGIGVVPFANKRDTRAVPVASSCGIVNTPSIFTIKTEEYIMQRRFYAYNRASVSPEAREFLDFLDDESLDDLVRKAGFIDLGVIAAPQTANIERAQAQMFDTDDATELRRLRDLIRDLQSTERLSTNFRFALGSSRLDVRSQADVRRIADYIIAERPSEVIFAGFTDSIGSFSTNQVLSDNRSATVRATVLARLPADVRNQVRLTSVGYSELEPAACNDADSGRRVNRRVEVWVR
ncbi:phosphate ABC transporter substrate-binding/OmpA family protein [Yoonia sp. F2084L]|uniref:phosphate ABC transporter substrate-binding/OmpA family protein n=1 Tax=Yoonia sp. F2084L TaxID=2926419 RepID=UPI001FF34B4E|nr:phosphate ABC transporter substrate-binding/OmpA family protein [Yoonia sp. F2084L]